MIKLCTLKILGIICNFALAKSKPVSNQLQLQLLLKADSVSDERIPDLPRIKKEPIHGRTDVKARRKRSSDTEYDYYKDTEYYNYYGVEDPYYDQNKTAEIEFNFEKSLDTQTQVLVVVSVLGLLWLFCIWQVCCYPALRLCGWYCAYWGTIVRMAFDACRGIDPRYRMMEKMVTSMGYAMPSYSEWKQWMAAYEEMMLSMAESQCEGITDMVKGFKGAMGPLGQMMGQGADQVGNVGAVMAGIGDGLVDYASGMPMGGVMF